MMIDHSKTNPKLHALHVYWAMLTLSEVQNFFTAMESRSSVTNFFLVDVMRKQVSQLIHENAAYRDAAAYIFAGHGPEEYNPDNNPLDNAEEPG